MRNQNGTDFNLTAIRRTDLSVPVRYLLRHDLLKRRILDFGCGFGYEYG